MKKRLFVITAVGLCIILFFVSVAGAGVDEPLSM